MYLLRKEIFNHKKLLLQYKSMIPAPQLAKFESDIKTIFDKFEETEDTTKLEGINKLAKTKYKAITKIYGELKDEYRRYSHLELFTPEQEKIVKDLSVQISEQGDGEIDKIEDLPGFNPTSVKKFREEYDHKSQEVHKELSKEYENYINKLVEDRKIQKERKEQNEQKEQKEQNEQDARKLNIKPEIIQEFLKDNNITGEERYERISKVEGFTEHIVELEKDKMKEYFKGVAENNLIPEHKNPMNNDENVRNVVKEMYGINRTNKYTLREEQIEAMEKQVPTAGK
jgi:hypothetical protein